MKNTQDNLVSNRNSSIKVNKNQTPLKKDSATTTKTTENQYDRVRLAAYFLAEKRNFEPGHELEDWIQAEKSVKRS